MAFPRGGPERGNPAMTTKRLRQGEKETHNFMLWEKTKTMQNLNSTQTYQIIDFRPNGH